MTFEKYQHVERIGSSPVDGLLNGKVYIFPKIDGANASVWMENGELKCGSRNRELDVDNNLNGFYQYVHKHEGIKKFLEEFPSVRLYGEWLTPHTIKDYNSTAWYQFYVFDVVTITGLYVSHMAYSILLKKLGVKVVEPLAEIENPTNQQIMDIAEQNTYLMESGKIGEGVVCKRYDFVNKFGRTVWGKYVRPAFKTDKSNKPLKSDDLTLIEEKIVNDTITLELVLKEKNKLLSNERFSGNIIPATLQSVWGCLITEELLGQLKKHKNPKIDFGALNRLCYARTKEHMGI